MLRLRHMAKTIEMSSVAQPSPKRLLVVTHVRHTEHNGMIYAYGPYVREINVWCDLFAEVNIAAPLQLASPDGDALAFSRDNLTVHPIPESGGETIVAKLRQLILLPWIVVRLSQAMWKADAIHIRCPGNLGLLGVILGPIFSNKLVAKYAGQWTGYPGEAKSVRLQRWLLASRWWRGVVTVYGQWPDQPNHVVPFFTSVMTPQQIARAKEIATRNKFSETFSIVFVGRLSKAKNVDVVIEAIAKLVRWGIDLRCDIVGHGAEDKSLRQLVDQHGLQNRIHFVGGVEFDRVFDYYNQSHVLVLASETEGWPKAIAEAMACGLVCVGSDRGLVPWMLGEGRGYTVEPGDVEALAKVLKRLATSSELRQKVSQNAAQFGQRYSLETLRDALAELLSVRWGTPVGPAPIKNADQRSSGTTTRKVIAP